jgi:hypothetical protein
MARLRSVTPVDAAAEVQAAAPTCARDAACSRSSSSSSSSNARPAVAQQKCAASSWQHQHTWACSTLAPVPALSDIPVHNSSIHDSSHSSLSYSAACNRRNQGGVKSSSMHSKESACHSPLQHCQAQRSMATAAICTLPQLIAAATG